MVDFDVESFIFNCRNNDEGHNQSQSNQNKNE